MPTERFVSVVNGCFRQALVLAAVVGSGLGIARAQDFSPYQLETGVHFQQIESGQFDGSFFGVSGQWNLEAVEGDGPLAERAFLSRVSYASARLGLLDINAGRVSGSNSMSLEFGGRYIVQKYPLTVELSIQSSSVDGETIENYKPPGSPGAPVPTKFNDDMDLKDRSLRVGYWYEDDLEIGGMLQTFSLKDDRGHVNLKESLLGAYAKTVREIAWKPINLEVTINLEGSVALIQSNYGGGGDTNIQADVAGDYYRDTGLSYGAAVRLNIGGANEQRGLGILGRVRYNHGTTYGGALTLGLFSPEVSGVDGSLSLSLSLFYRR